jgi:hypothetical protein
MAGRRMRRRTQPGHEHRARWWRDQIASATTSADQYPQVQRWLHAVAARAQPADRDQAFNEASHAIAAIAARLERRTVR